MPHKKTAKALELPKYDITAFVKIYIKHVPPLLLGLRNGSESIAAPHSEYLTRIFPNNIVNVGNMIDQTLRIHHPLYLIKYDELSIYLDMLMLSLQFINMNLNIPEVRELYKESEETYSTIIAVILRIKLNNGFDLIKKLHQSKLLDKSNPEKIDLINALLKKTYNTLIDTFELFTKHVEQYSDLIKHKINDEIKNEFYQCYFESLIFRATANTQLTKNELLSLGTDTCIELLDKYAGTKPHRLDLILAKSRNALIIHKAKDRALKLAELGTSEVKSLAFDRSIPDKILFDYNNHFALLRSEIQREIIDEQLRTSSSCITIEQINDLYDTLLEARETLPKSESSIEGQFIRIIHYAILMLSILAAKKIDYSNLETLNQLELLARKAFDLTRFLSNLKASSIPAEIAQSTVNHSRSVLDIIKQIQLKSEELRESETKSEVEYHALNAEMIAYEKEFEKLLSEFASSKTQRIIKKRKITVYNTPTTLPIPSSSPEQVSTPIHEAPTFAQRAQDYFACTSLDEIRSFLDTLSDAEFAEGLLYVGDYYFTHHDLPAALEMYEKAIKQCSLSPYTNTMLTKAIKIQLEETSKMLEKQLKKASDYLDKLKMMRLDFVLRLGIQKLKQEGVESRRLNPEIPEYRDAILARGNAAYITIGQEKRMQGLPSSEKTQKRNALHDQIAHLNSALALTTKMLHEVSELSYKENFPRLQQSTTLFRQGSHGELTSDASLDVTESLSPGPGQ